MGGLRRWAPGGWRSGRTGRSGPSGGLCGGGRALSSLVPLLSSPVLVAPAFTLAGSRTLTFAPCVPNPTTPAPLLHRAPADGASTQHRRLHHGYVPYPSDGGGGSATANHLLTSLLLPRTTISSMSPATITSTVVAVSQPHPSHRSYVPPTYSQPQPTRHQARVFRVFKLGKVGPPSSLHPHPHPHPFNPTHLA